MLDTQITGKNIAKMRKERNLTQMDLAERLFVSYQAVSSWERGLTMPDIDKLVDLTKIFGCTVEELTSMQSGIISKAANCESVPLANLVDIAPIVPPKKLEENIKQTDCRILTGEQLIKLAPFLESQTLCSLSKSIDGISLSELADIAPYFNDEATMETLLVACADQITLSTLNTFAPFISQHKLDEFAEKAEQVDYDGVIKLAPYLSQPGLSRLLQKLTK